MAITTKRCTTLSLNGIKHRVTGEHRVNRNLTQGFTLIELMIVVVIIGILAAIGYPSYIEQVTKTKRSDGKVALMTVALSLESCFTQYNAYNHANCAFTATSSEGHYAITSVDTTTTFTLTATPQATQTDSLCSELSLTNTGVQGESGTGTVANCW